MYHLKQFVLTFFTVLCNTFTGNKICMCQCNETWVESFDLDFQKSLMQCLPKFGNSNCSQKLRERHFWTRVSYFAHFDIFWKRSLVIHIHYSIGMMNITFGCWPWYAFSNIYIWNSIKVPLKELDCFWLLLLRSFKEHVSKTFSFERRTYCFIPISFLRSRTPFHRLYMLHYCIDYSYFWLLECHSILGMKS